MKKYLIFGILLVSFLGRLTAQEVKFEGSASSPVETGEQFRLIYTLNADGSYFIGPAIQNFAVIAGPSESSSSSVQYINGHVMQSASMSFSFILQAVKPGTYTLPAASVVVNGKKLLSNTVTIKVVKGSGSSSQGSRRTPYSFHEKVPPGGNCWFRVQGLSMHAGAVHICPAKRNQGKVAWSIASAMAQNLIMNATHLWSAPALPACRRRSPPAIAASMS